MRLALLVASSYSESPELLELPSAEVDLDLLGQRLSEPDAGFRVMAFRAERRLGEAIEQVLAELGEPVDQLFFYFAGYAMISDERGPALLLDGERLSAFSLKRLKRLLGEKSQRSLAVLDTISAFNGQYTPAQTVQALAAGLYAPDASTHVLLASRPAEETSGRSPFTSLLELVLDWQSVKSEPLGAEGLFTAMRAEESMFAELPAVEYFPGATPFELLRAPGGSPSFPSLPPPASPSHAPSAFPPPVFAGDEVPSQGERAQALEQASAATTAGEHAAAIEHFRTAARAAPRDAAVYHALLQSFRHVRRPDGSFNAASVLDLLGAADIDESLLASAHRPEGLLAAQGVLKETDWQQKLFCLDRDPALDGLFSALGDATTALGVETANRKRRAPALNPASEQDPEKSTTMLARTLLWSSRLLGILRPKLYVLDSVPGDLAVAPSVESVMLAGKTLGSGLGLPELAFLWARRLVLLRPEHRALALFQPEELVSLVRAAQALGSSNGAARTLDADAKLFLRALKRHLREPRMAAVVAAARAVPSSSLTARLAAFQRSVDRAAGRAGLLACGNLELCAKLTERFPLKGDVDATAQVGDLLCFAVSEEYATLRERLGIAVSAE